MRSRTKAASVIDAMGWIAQRFDERQCGREELRPLSNDRHTCAHAESKPAHIGVCWARCMRGKRAHVLLLSHVKPVLPSGAIVLAALALLLPLAWSLCACERNLQSAMCQWP